MRDYFDCINKFEAPAKAKNLRTFLPYGSRDQEDCYLTGNVPLDLLPKLRCLRVPSLRRCKIGELSSKIGDLRREVS